MDVLISIIRTVIAPTLFGFLISTLILFGIEEPSPELRAALVAVCAMVWYISAKFLQTVHPRFGLMLLVAVNPQYVESDEDGEAKMQDDILLAIRRTVFPLLVGWAVPQLVARGVTIDTATAEVALQAGFTTVYYGLIRLIEQRKVNAGLLIGGRAALTY